MSAGSVRPYHPVPGGGRKNVTVRFSLHDFDRIRSQATAAGKGTAGYIRELVLTALNQQKA